MNITGSGDDGISRSLLRDDIRDTILDAILMQELKSGQRIVETRWARNLGVSQAPVREAIRELEVMGLAENKPYQGSFVRAPSPKDMRDAYEVRLALESMAVRDAVHVISDADLDSMNTLVGTMREAISAWDLRAFLHADILFHETVVCASGNEMLLRMWKLSKMTEWTHLSARLKPVDTEELALSHKKIVDALKSRSESAALAAVREHIIGFMRSIKPVLEGGLK